MSLGFLTESALMPSKAKHIKVDGRSQLPLRAFVAEEMSKKEALGLKGHRKGRGKKRMMEEGRRDMYQGKNKGIEERKKRDAIRDKTENSAEREKNFEHILKKKAEDYDRIVKGEIDDDLEEEDEDNLVDFAKKRRLHEEEEDEKKRQRAGGEGRSKGEEKEGDNSTGTSRKGEKDAHLPKGMAEMVDEFGRTRLVSKQSEEYKAYKAVQTAQRRHEAFFGKKGDRRDGGDGGEEGNSTSYHEAGGGRREREGGGMQREDAEGEGGGQWAWSRGEEEENEKAKKKAEKRRGKERRREEEDEERPTVRTTHDGAIMTQWDRRLYNQAQGFLQQVISEEAAAGGGKGGDKADTIHRQRLQEKDAKRAKLLERMKQKQAQGGAGGGTGS